MRETSEKGFKACPSFAALYGAALGERRTSLPDKASSRGERRDPKHNRSLPCRARVLVVEERRLFVYLHYLKEFRSCGLHETSENDSKLVHRSRPCMRPLLGRGEPRCPVGGLPWGEARYQTQSFVALQAPRCRGRGEHLFTYTT